MVIVRKTVLATALAVVLGACSGSSNTGDPVGTAPPPNPGPQDSGCTGSCNNANSFLTVADVNRVIAQAVAEATARNQPAVIAVTDRVGNVLGVYRMNGVRRTVRIGTARSVVGGLEGLNIPNELAAIAKAITGAYLSSEGNAFSTRTASQIVQEHFNPGEFGGPSGPLFGVQFSQLPCSDLSNRAGGGGTMPGPHRSPLGLSADPGGLPLYKDGVPVGGIGVAADPDYSLDPRTVDFDLDLDELIAVAGTFGFAAPLDRRGEVITADGKNFRFSDVDFTNLEVTPGAVANLATSGAMTAVVAYSTGAVRAGTVFGQPASGIRPDTTLYPSRDAFVLVDANGAPRYAPRAGSDGAGAISAEEARVIIDEALAIANAARAQIRRPLGTQARVSMTVVDTNGVVLALARTRDAPVFGTDVALQKARTAMFFSGSFAAADLLSRPQVRYLNGTLQPNEANPTTFAFVTTGLARPGDYVGRLRDFIERPNALADGGIAITDRAVGNLARPYHPDGIVNPQSGPLSRPFDQWSPFHDGIQLDLVYNALAQHAAIYLNQQPLTLTLDGGPFAPAPSPANPLPVPDVRQGACGGADLLDQGNLRLGNGIQIFPGGVPIYRGDRLVGGIGISGDGIDQDDMIAFLGLHNAGVRLNSGIGNAPIAIRADQIVARGSRLRYVQCPQAPFIGNDQTNVCGGK